MKKIFLIIVLSLGLCGNMFAQMIQDSSLIIKTPLGDIYPGFWVKIGLRNVSVSAGTLEKQAQYIAKRATEPVDGQQFFDFAFFDSALVVFALQDTSKIGKSYVNALNLWRSCLSFEGKTVIKEEFMRFLIQAKEEYEIDVKYILSTEQYDLLLLGKVQIQVLKESCGSGKKRVEIPQDSYRMIAMKQPLN